MKTTNTNEAGAVGTSETQSFDQLWGKSWIYIKTVVDIVREPVLILDKGLCVMKANEAFYRTFQVDPKETEQRVIYELGNGQWNIPALRRLLEDILPKNSFFKGFEVIHAFPVIGRKVMILNARQIHSIDEAVESPHAESFPPIILLAIEDVTEMMAIAETLAGHANHSDLKFAEKARKLDLHIGKLEREIDELKKKV